MKLKSKAYTLTRLVKEVRATKARAQTPSQLLEELSPRAGAKSVRVKALNYFLNGKLYSILNGKGSFVKLGSSPRERLLKALIKRKQG